jgi:signal transduction histidine kinase
MFNTRIFRRHYFITALVLVAFIFVGHLANLAMVRMSQPARLDQPLFFARVIQKLDPKDPVHGLALLESSREGTPPPFDLSIAEADGKFLYPANRRGRPAWSGEAPKLGEMEMFQALPPEGFGPSLLEAIGGSPAPRAQDAVVRLVGEPTRYLVSKRIRTNIGGKPVFFSFAILVTSILGGAGVSLMILFRSLRLKAALADHVIADLQSGNLKARFPIDRMDEIGQTMVRFNRMADEIERLVDRLRTTEQSRMQLLQELGHDLRTPVASLRNMLETLTNKAATLDPKVGRELLDLSLREVDYFGRLIEDLLVLAQIGEPNYQIVTVPTDLTSLVEEEAELLLSRRSGNGHDRRVDVNLPDLPVEVAGDAHLLRRAVRNALENAFDFSRERIAVDFGREANGQAKLEIRDDGPGFSPEQLAKFGERRMTRVFGTQCAGRISIGLGSVIMKTILDIHRGSLVAENWTAGDGRPGGARVILRLPAA